MKELRRMLKKALALLFFFTALSLSAQLTEIKNALYHVVSDGGAADAALVMRELELRFEVYNRIFGFDAAAIGEPLRVRALGNKEDYDEYILERLGKLRDGAVYLHYGRKDMRELVIHRGGAGEAAALPHQIFVQFLRAFTEHPPAWLLQGFAVFFSSLVYDPERDALDYTENLAWLDEVKGLGDTAPSLEAVLFVSDGDEPEHFQPLAWSLVSFFLNSGQELYSRILTEIFMTLDPEAGQQAAGAAANAETGQQAAVAKRILLRTDMEALNRDYRAYIMGRKTFTELIMEGRAAYDRKDAAAAELSFLEAGNLNPRHYAPHYYLGLLAYEKGNYGEAEEYYRAALEHGADSGLVNFALGLNAAVSGRKAEAGTFLEEAVKASPERFSRKAEDIMIQLKRR
jgi:tetratricopeptide (TPR) repeat protein